MGLMPLFVRMPNNLHAKRIDMQSKDLATRTCLFQNPEYDNYTPLLLRLTPACCAKLATAKEVEVSEFPYAICLAGVSHSIHDDDTKSNKNETRLIPEFVTTVQIPPNQEIYPTLLDSAKVCWKLFLPDTQDFSVYVPLTVSADMVIGRSDYSAERIAALRKTASRQKAKKTTSGYIERHERPRRMLMELAEQVVKDNPSQCNSFSNWAAEVFDLRTTTPFNGLLEVMPDLKLRWIQETLRDRYEFANGKPVRRTFTPPE